MRRRRMWIVLLLALVSGLTAAYLALNYLRQPTSPIRAATPSSTELVVASRDLELGTVLGPQDVKLIGWPSEALPEGYSASTEEVLGRGVIAPLRMNEPLLPGKLAKKEEGGGLPIVIPEGMRAVSVRVDEVISVAGFVLPSTRVDVLVTLTREAGTQGNPITKLILQNVPVLSSGQTIQRDEQGQPLNVTVVTLLVTPDEAEKLVLASTEGRIQLALRNTLDLDTVQTEGIRVSGLIPSQRPAAPVRRTVSRQPPPRASAATVEVYRGPQLETTTVEREGGSQ